MIPMKLRLVFLPWRVMSLPTRASRAKYHWGIAFATRLKRFTDPVTKLRMKHTNHRVRIPKGLYPHRIEAKMTKKQVGGKWILVREMTMISKDGEISKFPEYHSFEEEEEPSEQPKPYDLYGFVDHPELQKNEFAPHQLPPQEGNMNGWLIEDEDEPQGYEASDKEVESDLESTARSKPKCKKLKKIAKVIPVYTFHDCPGPSNKENPDIDTIIAQQLQNILPQIVTQVTNNVNNANGGNGRNGGNNGCTYKGFMACNPKEYDGKGGAIVLTRWIEKMENVIENSGCAENQKVKYAASSFKVEVDRIIRNCKLELGNSLFTIDLIPLGHGSFDVIVGMDWLSKHKTEIVCHKKVVRIPLESDEILHVLGERTPRIAKALSNVKVDEPQLSDISIVRDFVKVFLEDLSRLPPQRQVEFRIDLVPEVTPVAKSPYRLAPSEMKELSGQLQELQDKVQEVPADYVSAGHVLISADRDRIC
ncbi:putative reverse transcriptase domain-containing protein [Tanacetum coccineum]